MGSSVIPIGVLRTAGRAGSLTAQPREIGGDFKSALIDAASRRERTESARATSSVESSADIAADQVEQDREYSSEESDPADGTAPTANEVTLLPPPPPAELVVQSELAIAAAEIGNQAADIAGRRSNVQPQIARPGSESESKREIPSANAKDTAPASRAPTRPRPPSADASAGSAPRHIVEQPGESAGRFGTQGNLSLLPTTEGGKFVDENPDLKNVGRPRSTAINPWVEPESGSGDVVATGVDRRQAAAKQNALENAKPVAPSPAHPNLQAAAQERPSDTAPVGESMFQRKVRRSVDDRREGSSDASWMQSASATLGGSAKRPATIGNKLSSKMIATMPTSETAPNRADEAQVTSGRGDSPAASIARLLVHGMMEQGAGANRIIDDLTGSAAQDVQHGTAAGGSLGTGGAAHVPASSPIAVAELLSGRDEQVGGIESLARSLQTSGSPGRFQATMRLDPPELGQVSVQIKMRDGVMTLNVQTENAGVTRLIESRMGDLHDALAEHGIRVEHTHVVTKSSETADARNELSRQRSSEFTQNEQGPSSSWTRHQDQPGWRGSAGHDGASDGGSADWTPSRSTDEFANQSIAMTQQWPPIREGSVNLVA